MKRLRMEVKGMTCDSCNLHVTRALERAGARDAQADWRKGEALFAVEEGVSLDPLIGAVRDEGYGPGRVTTLESEGDGRARGGPADYDLLIIGAGSGAFAAAIRARDQGARVGMVEQGTVGGTCVNVGCVPSKALLRAGEVYWLGRR